MKTKLYLMLSASLAGFFIHQGFSGPDFNDADITSISSRYSPAESGIDLNDAQIKTLISMPASVDLDQDDFNKSAVVVASAPQIAEFSLEDVRSTARIVQASYTDNFAQADVIKDMESKGFKTLHIENDATKRNGGLIFIKGKKIIISYRGTEAGTDFVTDFNGTMMKNPYGPGMVHKGFLWEFDRTRDSVFNAVYNHAMENKIAFEDLEVEVSGHSLGSALATLCVQRLYKDLDVQPKNIKMVTFASPRVGNHEFAQAFDSVMKDRTLRVNQTNMDPVTGIGPKQMGYQHVGIPLDVKVEEYGFKDKLTFATHFMAGYIIAVDRLDANTFKAREAVQEASSQSYAGYVAAAGRYAVGGVVNGVVGGVLKGANWLDPTSYAPIAIGFNYEGKKPENCIPQEMVQGKIKGVLKDLTMVNDELVDMIKSNATQEDVFIMREQQLKALMAVGNVLDHIKADPFVRRTLTDEHKKIFGTVEPLYKDFQSQVQKTQNQAAKIDDLVTVNEESLTSYEGLKLAFEAQKETLSSTNRKDMEKIVKHAETEYKKNAKDLESARQEMEKRIKKLDASKDKLMDVITTYGHKFAS